jgi:hypothetical protein
MRATFALLFGVPLALAWGRPAFAQGQTDPIDRLLNMWAERQRAVSTVAMDLNGERIFPRGLIQTDSRGNPLSPPLPTADTPTPVRRRILLDFARNQFRLEFDEQGYSRRGPYAICRTRVFSGDKFKVLNPGDRNPDITYKDRDPDLAIITGDAGTRSFEFHHWPIFEALGILQSVDQVGPRSTAKELAPTVKPGFLRFHGEAVHQGRRCLVVRTPARGPKTGRSEEYWVDLSRGALILKHLLLTSDHAPRGDWVISYKRGPVTWEPTNWVFTERDTKGRITLVERITVTSCSINQDIPPGEFDLEERPGMLVARSHVEPSMTAPGSAPTVLDQRFFHVRDDGQAVEVDRNSGVPVARFWPWARWVFGAVVVALAGLAAWQFARRGRRRSASLRAT